MPKTGRPPTGRTTVTGNFFLNAPPAPDLRMNNLLGGLTAPDCTPATIPRGRGAFGGGADETSDLRNFSAVTNHRIQRH